MEYWLKAEQLCVGYQGKPLVRDMEICLKKGEILTLIGPNGSGKSTILKSIARQLQCLGGAVYLDGTELGQMSGEALSRKMAVVFTEKVRTELMTCEDVVATGRYPYTGRWGILSEKDRKATEEAMRLVHITEIRQQDFTKISDGQRQRVMLARAICQEPEVIVLDEPTSFLDLKYKLEFLSVLQSLQKEKGLTVVMSLQELELAKKVSDKVLCIGENGLAECFGSPQEMLDKNYICRLFQIDERLLAYADSLGILFP